MQKINENIQVVKNEVNQPGQVPQIQWLPSHGRNRTSGPPQISKLSTFDHKNKTN
jgi:hypothetical protein